MVHLWKLDIVTNNSAWWNSSFFIIHFIGFIVEQSSYNAQQTIVSLHQYHCFKTSDIIYFRSISNPIHNNHAHMLRTFYDVDVVRLCDTPLFRKLLWRQRVKRIVSCFSCRIYHSCITDVSRMHCSKKFSMARFAMPRIMALSEMICVRRYVLTEKVRWKNYKLW